MRGFETRLTQKGQVTIPVEIRDKLGLKPRDTVRFELDGTELKLRPVRSRLIEGYGAVAPLAHPEDWRAIREEMEEAMAQDVAAEG